MKSSPAETTLERYLIITRSLLKVPFCLEQSWGQRFGYYLALWGHPSFFKHYPSVLDALWSWENISKHLFHIQGYRSLIRTDQVLNNTLLWQINLLERILAQLPVHAISFDGFDVSVTSETSMFLERLMGIIVSSPSQHCSIKAFKCLKQGIQKLDPQSKIHCIMKMLTSFVPTLEVTGLELLKDSIHFEFTHPPALKGAKWFTTTLFPKTFYPLLFDPLSNLYKTSIMGKDSSILNDEALFLQKVDVIMHILNLYRYVSIRDQSCKVSDIN